MRQANGKVVVATTIPAYVMDKPESYEAWLYNAEAMREDWPMVEFFAALETDSRGRCVFDPIMHRLAELHGHWWFFHLDDGAEEITTANRLRRITTGQNLATDYSLSAGCTHMLFMAADCAPPGDAISKLLELDHPLVGGHVSTYCLDGPVVPKYIPTHRDQIREHMATAAFVMIRRDLLRFIRWRWDSEVGMSDDPCLHHDAQTFHDIPTYVHHGVVGKHFPESIGPIEDRHHDRRLYR